jgi:hypothetical protein
MIKTVKTWKWLYEVIINENVSSSKFMFECVKSTKWRKMFFKAGTNEKKSKFPLCNSLPQHTVFDGVVKQ